MIPCRGMESYPTSSTFVYVEQCLASFKATLIKTPFNTLSRKFSRQNGVHQGEVLSVSLFIVKLNSFAQAC